MQEQSSQRQRASQKQATTSELSDEIKRLKMQLDQANARAEKERQEKEQANVRAEKKRQEKEKARYDKKKKLVRANDRGHNSRHLQNTNYLTMLEFYKILLVFENKRLGHQQNRLVQQNISL